MELDFNELRELLALLNQTDIAEFTLKSNDFELIVRKGVQASDTAVESLPNAAIGSLLARSLSTDAPFGTDVASPTPVVPTPPLPTAVDVSTPPITPAAATPLASDRLVEIISPMVGTFYRSPGPDEAPYIEVGDRISPGQAVCIIEAMKLMNEIEAEVSGEIVEILLQSGESVEYGQPLMRVNPLLS